MIDLKHLLKPKRYRGLWEGKNEKNYINFDIISANDTRVRITNIFPIEIKDRIKEKDKIQCFANTKEGFILITFEVESVNKYVILNLLNLTYDKRKAVRIYLGDVYDIKVVLHKDHKSYEGRLKDISLAGMNAEFKVIPPGIKAGDIEVFEFEYNMMGGVVTAQIKRIIKEKDRYMIAVEFTKEDPEEVEIIHSFISNAYMNIFKT